KSRAETNGMSQATTSTGCAARVSAAWMPPSAPLPGRTSEATGTPGSQAAALGSFAMRSTSSAAAASAAATRSITRRPPTRSRPLGKPPNRDARPPARMAPVQRAVIAGLTALERRRQRFVFGDVDPHELDAGGQPRCDALENEACEVLAGRDEPAVGKLGDVEVDVAVIEARGD